MRRFQIHDGQFDVPLRRLQLRVPQHLLQVTDIGMVLNEVGGKRMPKHMR